MGWDKLAAELRAARERREAERLEPPVHCPIDGARLEIHPDNPNLRHCPMGNYVWEGELDVGRDGLGVR